MVVIMLDTRNLGNKLTYLFKLKITVTATFIVLRERNGEDAISTARAFERHETTNDLAV
jgi:hypothetical protein